MVQRETEVQIKDVETVEDSTKAWGQESMVKTCFTTVAVSEPYGRLPTDRTVSVRTGKPRGRA